MQAVLLVGFAGRPFTLRPKSFFLLVRYARSPNPKKETTMNFAARDPRNNA